jgi:hypothetical protein
MTRWRLLTIAVIAAVVAVPSAQAHQGTGKAWTTVASGLDSPRGINFDKHGNLWIAEAGRGGAGPCFPGEDPTGPQTCFGASGAFTLVHNGTQKRVVTGLPSLGDEGTGDNALGASDILPVGKRIVGLIGAGGNPDDRAKLAAADPAANLFGWAVKVNPWNGSVWPFADFVQYEADNNPDGGNPAEGGIDSDAYGLAERHGRLIVADAGGNDVLSVKGKKHISTLAVFPDVIVPFPTATDKFPMQAVPTSVAVRRGDPNIYVGQLTGFPFVPGAANVWRIQKDGTTDVYASGFTNIVDIAWGPKGSLYVLEISASGLASDDPGPGALWRVWPNGDRKLVASTGLVSPTAVAIAKDGSVYVANYGTSAGGGTVVNIGKV